MRKSAIQEIVDALPEDKEVDVDALLERLYLLQKIEHGERQIAAGQTIEHEEAVKRLKPWLE